MAWQVQGAKPKFSAVVQPIVDGLIAATVRVRSLTVVTWNETDFRRAGVSVLNPLAP